MGATYRGRDGALVRVDSFTTDPHTGQDRIGYVIKTGPRKGLHESRSPSDFSLNFAFVKPPPAAEPVITPEEQAAHEAYLKTLKEPPPVTSGKF
jgi:hypothetical protein